MRRHKHFGRNRTVAFVRYMVGRAEKNTVAHRERWSWLHGRTAERVSRVRGGGGNADRGDFEPVVEQIDGERDSDHGCVGSASAVDSDLKGRADFAHPGVGKPAKSADQDYDRDAFDRVQVNRRTARDRVEIRLEDNLAGESPDGRRAWRDEGTSKSRDRGITRQDNNRAAADLGQLAPPHLTASRQRTHDAPAARRHDAKSPHSSGSSTGCSS